MLRNHTALCKDTARFVPEVDAAAVDAALRVCVHALLTAGESDAQAESMMQVCLCLRCCAVSVSVAHGLITHRRLVVTTATRRQRWRSWATSSCARCGPWRISTPAACACLATWAACPLPPSSVR